MALVRRVQQFGCVFQDAGPPKHLRKGTNSLRRKKHIQFAPEASQSANILERKPSLGVIQPTHPHERSFSLCKNYRRETRKIPRQKSDGLAEKPGNWHELCVKKRPGSKQSHIPLTSGSLVCLPAPSPIKPEKGEFVVDSGSSMHILSRNDSNAAELETVRVSRNPY